MKGFRIVRPCSGGKEDKEVEVQFHITNHLALNSREEAESILGYRWTIEQYHREPKQMTGVERCQARKQRSQRNHITALSSRG
ncbi:transposase [Candidatus Poribacteria bacterium]|nr:transposase [Candidatus Poribacteria bacterium]